MNAKTLHSLDPRTVITLCEREATTRLGISKPLSVALLATAQALRLEVGLLRSAWPADTEGQPGLPNNGPTLDSIAQLDALPSGAVVLDKDGCPYIRRAVGGWDDGLGGVDTSVLATLAPCRLLCLPPSPDTK